MTPSSFLTDGRKTEKSAVLTHTDAPHRSEKWHLVLTIAVAVAQSLLLSTNKFLVRFNT